tara:strand:+ start:620 stop:1096 length:477 start_codon:yes stop_codon:yes gene_type:complete
MQVIYLFVLTVSILSPYSSIDTIFKLTRNMSKDLNKGVLELRSPPSDYENMNTFELGTEVFYNGDFMACSQEVVDLFKERLNITGRKINPLNTETAFLAGYDYFDPDNISHFVDKEGNRTAIFFLVSPSEGSDSSLWWNYTICAGDGGKTPFRSLRYG